MGNKLDIDDLKKIDIHRANGRILFSLLFILLSNRIIDLINILVMYINLLYIFRRLDAMSNTEYLLYMYISVLIITIIHIMKDFVVMSLPCTL